MADQDDLTVPTDIPWQLLSRRGPDSADDPTSLATFVYVPLVPELEKAYPDDRIVYFKFSASVFPFHLDVPKAAPLDVLDEAFAPVWRMVLDVEITRKSGAGAASLKPYFLSAAPTRRAMIETGVVGDYVTEGESDEVAIGRSASHLIEGFHSTTKTRKFGIGGALGGLAFGALPIGGGLSYSRGSTSISGGREVTEQLDTTNRQSSEERRELLSHMTNASNVLTLLNGSLVGTNRLQLSLWPPPLRPLSIDPNDENLWYAELLKRRSSGIEGMQDFFAVAVVPRGEGFCLSETLRRVSVLEPPLPRPPVQPSATFDTFNFDLNDFVRVYAYLSGKYPEGTPLEDLDVSMEDRLAPDPAAAPPVPGSHSREDLQAWYNAVGAVWVPNPLPAFPPPAPLNLDAMVLNIWLNQALEVLANLAAAVKIEMQPRPVVSGWTFSNTLPPSMLRLHALTTPPSLPVPYKWVQDVWLEAAQYDYESELARSPLERGAILIDDRQVDICADVDQEGAIGEVTTTLPKTPDIRVLPPVPATGVVRPWDATASSDPRIRGRVMVSAWGMADAQLGTRLSGRSALPSTPLSFQDPHLLDVYLGRAARLPRGDARNLTLGELSRRFRLSAADVQQLKAGGISDLSSLASAILAAQQIERLGRPQPFVRDKRSRDALMARTLPAELTRSIVESIGAALDVLLQKQPRTRAASPRRHVHQPRRRHGTRPPGR